VGYASQADMVTRFGNAEVVALTDRSNQGIIDPDVLAGGLAEADAEIDPYLSPRYPLPLPTVPRILVGLACDIARYRLCSSTVIATEEIRNRYRDAVRFLEKIADNKIGLGVDASGLAPPEDASVQVSSTFPDRIFNDDSLLGY
jgi:phage gp36-like protein